MAAILVGNGVDSGEEGEAAGTCSTRADGERKKTRVDFRVVLLQTSNYTAALVALSKIWPQSKDISPLWRGFLFIQLVLFFSLERLSNLLKRCSGFLFFFYGPDLSLETLKRRIFSTGMKSLIEMFLLPNWSLNMENGPCCCG